jgi:ABC-type branched-subunit amino acid transport system substrate-binding protein
MFKLVRCLSVLILTLAAPAAFARGDVCIVASALQSMHTSSFKSAYLVRAHEMAVEDEPTAPKRKANEVRAYTADGTDVDLLATLKRAIDEGCKVVVGLYTSRECLLAGPFLVERGVIAISSGCGHDGIEKFKDNLLTVVPPLSRYADKIADTLNAGSDAVYVLYQPTDVYSRMVKETIERHLKRPATFVELDKSGKGDLTKLADKGARTVVFAIYPSVSVPVIEELARSGRLGAETTVIGASSWPFDLSALRKTKESFAGAKAVLIPDVFDPKPAQASPFAKAYAKRFGQRPENLALFSYDVTRFALKCRAQSGEAFDLAKFRACMHKEPYKGVSGVMKFAPGSAFSQRDVFMTDLMPRF